MKKMKKISMLFLAAVAAIGFGSCNTSSVDQGSRMSFVTVHTLTVGSYYFETDTGKLVWPGDTSRVPGYVAKEGQRALIVFNVLDTPAPMPGYDYNIALYDIGTIYSSAARIVSSETEMETLKDDPVEFRGARLQGHWTTMVVRYSAYDVSKHKFALIVNEVEPATGSEEGYLDMELRHDNGDEVQGMLYESYISFDLSGLEELLEGKKGIRLRFKNGSSTEYFKIDRIVAETDAKTL